MTNTAAHMTSQDQVLSQLEDIASRLERGEISPTQADEESGLIMAELEKQTHALVQSSIEERTGMRRKKALAALLLIGAILVYGYFKTSAA